MAAPTQYRPWRSLVILALAIAALAVFAFWPGTVHTPQLGLDLRGGTQVTLTPRSVGGQTINDQQIQQAVEIIRQRVNGLGVAESEVTTQGNGSNAAIIVSIPGVNNQGIADSLKQTALLDFRAVVQQESGIPATAPTAAPSSSPTPKASASTSPKATASPKASASTKGAAVTGGLRAAGSASPTPSATPAPSATTSAAGDKLVPPIMSDKNDAALQAKFAALDCSDPAARKGAVPQDPAKWLVTCSTDGQAKYLLQPAFIRGTNISDANAGIPQGGNTWIVNLSFDADGAKKLATASTDMYTKSPPQNQFAIVLDGLVFSSPYFKEPILGGSAQIEGQLHPGERSTAGQRAQVRRAAADSLEMATVDLVSPTLGQDQLNAGVHRGPARPAARGSLPAGLLPGARARRGRSASSYAAIITYALVVILGRTIGFTLTLAGVTGVIVAIGITADSFVVYFERMRDEIRDGRTLRVGVETGWHRARRTILAADFVSFLAAVVLYLISRRRRPRLRVHSRSDHAHRPRRSCSCSPSR